MAPMAALCMAMLLVPAGALVEGPHGMARQPGLNEIGEFVRGVIVFGTIIILGIGKKMFQVLCNTVRMCYNLSGGVFIGGWARVNVLNELQNSDLALHMATVWNESVDL
jgi:hypothetical protein